MCRSIMLLAAGLLTACAGSRVTSAPILPAAAPTLDRMTIRSAEQQVVVDSPLVAGRRVERMIH